MLHLSSAVKDDTYALRASGDIDHTCNRKRLKENLKRGASYKKIYFDLSEVEFAGSVLLDTLSFFASIYKNKSNKLYLLNPPEHIIDLLTVTHHIHIFNILYEVNN